MMKNKIIFLFFLLFSVSFSAGFSEPLAELWSYRMQADAIYLVDLNKDGLLEVFVVSYGERLGCIRSFSYNGSEFFGDCLQGFSRATYPFASEKYNFIYVDDLGYDGVLDVLAASYIRGTTINVRKIYGIQRIYVPGLRRYEYDLVWDYTTENAVSAIDAADVDSDGSPEAVAASLESKVYFFSGRHIKQVISLGGEGALSLHVSEPDALGNVFVAVGSLSRLYVINCSKKASCRMKWNSSIGSRVVGVFSADVDSDNLLEFLVLSEDGVRLLDDDSKLLWFRGLESAVASWVKDVDNDKEIDVLVLADDSMYLFDKNGFLRWRHSFGEKLLSLSVDVYNNIFVGSVNRIQHLVVNQDYALNNQASIEYSRAYSLYTEGKYSDARYYARRARRMFEMVNNLQGMMDCDFILMMTEKNVTVSDKQYKAYEYYSLASELLGNNSFDEAKRYADLALGIYLDLKNREAAIKVDILLARIEEKKRGFILKKAEDEYSLASSAASNKLFDEAREHAKAASEAFSEINDSAGVKKSESLLKEIGLMERRYVAESSHKLALSSLADRNYSDALSYAEKASEAYDELNDSRYLECINLVNLSRRYLEAESYYKLALDNYRRNNLDNATSLAEKAKEIYISLNNSEKADDCIFFLREIQKSRTSILVNYLVLAAPLLVFLAVVIILHQRRRRGY